MPNYVQHTIFFNSFEKGIQRTIETKFPVYAVAVSQKFIYCGGGILSHNLEEDKGTKLISLFAHKKQNEVNWPCLYTKQIQKQFTIFSLLNLGKK